MSEKHERAIEAAADWLRMMWPEVPALKAAKEIIAAYQGTMAETAEGEVRVRVCVAVNSTGGAMWVGGNGLDDEGNRDCSASAGLDRPVQFRWIEATVPGWQPPAEVVVEGEVVG